MANKTTAKQNPTPQRPIQGQKLDMGKLVLTVKNFFITSPHIWLSFLIPFAVLFAAYAYFEIYPFGERSVLCLDLNAQYAFYFQYFKDALMGHESFFYAWNRNLSGEFVGIIGYYLFSPFNIFVWLAPYDALTEGLALMILTKIGAIGVTMAIYLSKGRGFSKFTTVIFSVSYALISYNIVQTMNPMWLDGVFALPLVVMGIEQLLKRGKYKMFVISLAYSFLTCFYIGYMVAIFSVLYYIYYALTSRKLNRKSEIVILCKRSALFAVCAIIAGLVSAFMLLPVYSALSMGKLEFSNPDFSFRTSFELFDLTRKLFPNSYDTVRMDGLPFIYAGTLTLLLLPGYFMCNKIRAVRRYAGVLLILALIASMMITPIDMRWHGGQVPNWLPYRYSFMLSFVMIAFAAEAFQHIKTIKRKYIGGTALALIILLSVWQQKDTFVSSLGSGRDIFPALETILPAMFVIIILTSLLILAKDKLNKHNFFTAALVAVIAMELFYNTQHSLTTQHTDIVYSTRKSWNEVFVPTRQVVEGILKEDKDFYRMEKLFIRSACDPMALRMKGITHSSSMLNDKAIAFLRSMGYAARSHMSRYWGATPLTDDLFGFKYVLSTYDNNPHNIKNPEDIIITKNEDVMPIAYLVDPKILQYEIGCSRFEDDVFTNQSKLLSYMLGRDTESYFHRMEFVDRRPQNVVRSEQSDGYIRYDKGDEGGDSHIEYDFIADEDGYFFMYFPSRRESRCNLWLGEYRMVINENGEEVEEFTSSRFIATVYETDNHHIQRLGKLEKGVKYRMTLSITKNDMQFRDEIVMRLDSDKLERDIAQLHAFNENTTFTAKSSTSLKVTTNHPEYTVLFTSIPMERGWTVRIGGKKVQPMSIIDVIVGRDGANQERREGTLMALNVPPGNQTITMKFVPHRFPEGVLMGLVGLAALAAMYYFLEKKKVANPFLHRNEDGNDWYDAPEAVRAEAPATQSEDDE